MNGWVSTFDLSSIMIQYSMTSTNTELQKSVKSLPTYDQIMTLKLFIFIVLVNREADFLCECEKEILTIYKRKVTLILFCV